MSAWCVCYFMVISKMLLRLGYKTVLFVSQTFLEQWSGKMAFDFWTCFSKKKLSVISLSFLMEIHSFQSHCRKHLAKLEYLRLKRATIVMQCAWRGRVARRELRKLRMVCILAHLQLFMFYICPLVLCCLHQSTWDLKLLNFQCLHINRCKKGHIHNFVVGS